MPNPSLGELFTQTWQKIDQMKLHVCLSGEYNVTTLVPTVDYPEENTFYLVPDGTGNNVYTEWIYVNDNWERFGQASIDLSDYVQKTDYANSSTAGVIKIGTTNTGLYLNPTSGILFTSPAAADELKAGTSTNKPVVPAHEHVAAFYGLAKAAGDTTQALSDNAVGTYTADAKAAIQSMLGIGRATGTNIGLVKTTSNLGLYISPEDGTLNIAKATDEQVKVGTQVYKPITPVNQHMATFYGLAKAAGDSTQAASANEIGTYTDDAKAAIQSMLGIGIADTTNAGLVKVSPAHGIGFDTDNSLYLTAPNAAQIRALNNSYYAVKLGYADKVTFYALAKAAGDSTQSVSDNAVGTYTNEAKVAIRNMLGVEDNFTRNSVNRVVSLGTITIDGTEKTTTLYIKLLQEGAAQLVIGSNATNINLTKSTANDKIYYTSTETVQDGVTPILTLYYDSSATVSATVTYQIASDTTYSGQQEITLYYPAYIVSTHGVAAFITSAKTGYATKLVSTDDIATDSTPGVVKVNAGHGIAIDSDGVLQLTTPTASQLQALSNGWLAPRLNTMHTATFYSLAKAAGDTTQSISNNAVGLYTDNAKASIQKMIGTYEAPWELIRDDTFTNATMTEYIISADDNNNSFELTDCYLWIIVPATDQTGDYGIGNFGRIRFLTDKANIYFDVMVSEVSNPTTSKVCGGWFTQQHGAIHLECTNLSDVGNTSPVRRFGTNNYDSQLAPLIIPLVYPRIITSVKIAAAQGTIKYRLYGRRKWQT